MKHALRLSLILAVFAASMFAQALSGPHPVILGSSPPLDLSCQHNGQHYVDTLAQYEYVCVSGKWQQVLTTNVPIPSSIVQSTDASTKLSDGASIVRTDANGNVSVGNRVPVTLTDGCPVLNGANQICVKDVPYLASGSAVTTTSVGTTAPGTSIAVADASSFSAGQGIYLAGGGAVDGIGGTIAYASGGTATGTGYCIATPTNGGGYNGQASVVVTTGTLSGNLTIIAPGQQYASVPTSWTLTLPQGAAALTCSGTIATTGGSLVAGNYVGTVSAIGGTTLTITPATITSVSAGAVVQHDESAAFQAAIDAISTTGGKIVVPDGFYRINAVPRNPTQANAVLIVPAVKYNVQDFGKQVGIELSAMSQAAYDAPASAVVVHDTGAIIQTNNTSGNIIGGWANVGTGTMGNITDVLLTIKQLTFRAYMAPSVTLIDASKIASLVLEGANGDVGVSAWNVGYTKPTSPNGRFVVTPNSNNGAQVILRNTQASGFYVGYSVSEHCQLIGVQPMSNHIGVEVRGSAHSLSGTRILAQWNDYGICASGRATINIGEMSVEHTSGTVEIYDPLNYLSGKISVVLSSVDQPPSIVGGAYLLITKTGMSALDGAHPVSLGGLTGWLRGGLVHGSANIDKISVSWTGTSVVLVPPTTATAAWYGGILYPGSVLSSNAPAFNFTGRTLSVKVSSVCKGTVETYFTISPTGTNVSRVWMQTYNGTLYFYKESGSVASVAYSPITHAYWRIREAAGTIYGDTSADGVTWNNLGSTTVTWGYTSIVIVFEVGVASAVAYPGFAQFDQFTIQ